MRGGTVLFFSPEPAHALAGELAAHRATPEIAPPPRIVPPADGRAWARAVSELALFNWILLPTPASANALIEAIGAPPGPLQQLAAVGAARDVLAEEDRVPEISAASLRAALTALSGHVTRRRRVLVPHAELAGRRIGPWLEELGAEAVCRAAYAIEGDSELPSVPRAAVVANPSEAETLARWFDAGRLARATPILALDNGAADAVEDCGLRATAGGLERFDAFLDAALDEALS